MTDEMWARLIEWLQARGLVLHVPITGPPYLTDQAGNYVRKF